MSPSPASEEASTRRARGATTRRSGGRKALIGLLILLLVLAAAVVATVWFVRANLDSKIERFDAFSQVSERPSTESTEDGTPVNFLLIGSDSRISAGDLQTIEYGQQRSDALMVVQVSADRKAVTVMSIPRDSWVPIPGHGTAKINAGLSYGGVPLAVQTVEELTGIRLDHVMMVDFESFTRLTDELGGVTIDTIDGPQQMNGEQALAFAQTRKTLPRGDFDRIRRQQAWMRSMAQAAFSKDVLSSPTTIYSLVDLLAETTLMDETLTVDRLQNLIIEARGIRPRAVRFVTAPDAGTGRSPDGKQSIVNLDMERCAPLFEAFATGQAAHYLFEHPDAAPSLDDRPVE
ncbi:MAG: LCP family protein [Bowdeniella nasicola]|nr:LCP family protein [Bowdeniella nasicola]